MSYEKFLEYLKLFLNNKQPTEISNSKGGWEGWLQAELWYDITFSENLVVGREVALPGGGGRCDLVIEALWVELKCFSAFTYPNIEGFITACKEDAVKLRDYAGGDGVAVSILPKYTGAQDFVGQALAEDGWAFGENDYLYIWYKAFG